jgi:hypothetical protein
MLQNQPKTLREGSERCKPLLGANFRSDGSKLFLRFDKPSGIDWTQ